MKSYKTIINNKPGERFRNAILSVRTGSAAPGDLFFYHAEPEQIPKSRATA